MLCTYLEVMAKDVYCGLEENFIMKKCFEK